MLKPVAALLLVHAALGYGLAAAEAHATLVVSVPADGAVVSGSPPEISVAFSEAVETALSGLDVTASDGSAVATTSAESSDPAMLVVHPSGVLSPGVYAVDWHAVADDGHKTEGEFSFTVK
jgi:methionine-rich copper-binding protein CopC